MQNFSSGKIKLNGTVFITDSNLMYHFLNYSVSDGFLIIHNGELNLFTDNRYYYFAKNRLKNANVYLINENSLKDFILNNKIEKIGIINEYTSVSTLNLLKESVEVCEVSTEVFELTSVKNENQIKLIKKSCKIIEKAYKRAVSEIYTGITERELSAKLEYYFKLYGADGVSFETIVAFGKGSAIPHYKTGDVKLEENMPVLIDFGAYYRGFASDCTRSFYYGTPNKEYKRTYKAVLNAHNKAFDNIKVGVTAKEIDSVARNELKKDNLDKYFTHSLGHGIGVKIHESPYLNKKSEYKLKNGNVFSDEPGVYFNGKFGIRIEDTVAIIDNKPTRLTNIKKIMAVKPHK